MIIISVSIMNFDDYGQHLAQKYRLAISIAILNIKPADLTIDEFLHQLRTTINEQNTDNIDDDLEISACSDDFNDSSDEVNDLNMNKKTSNDQNHMKESHKHTDFNDQNYMNQNDCNLRENDDHDDVVEEIVVHESQDEDEMKINNESQINDNGRKNNEETQGDAVAKANHKEMDSNASNVLNNTKVSDAAKKQRRDKFRELIKVLKGNDVAPDKVANDSQQIFQNSLQLFDPNDSDLTQCDNNNSITESINTLNNIDKEFNQKEHSETQVRELNYTREMTNVKRKKINNELCDRNSKITKSDSNFQITKEIISNENVIKPKTIEKSRDFEMNMGDNIKLVNDSNNISRKASTNSNERQIAPILIDIDTQETFLYTDTQFNTHYSQSQMNEVIVDIQFIHGNKNKKDIENSNKIISKKANINTGTPIYLKNPVNFNEDNENFVKHQEQNTNNKSNANFEHTALQENLCKDQNERNIIEKDTAFSQNMDLDVILQPFNNDSNAFENCTIFDETTSTDRNDTTLTNEKGSTVFDKTSSDRNIETESADGKEKIPFKIIEEMNRIKIYLRRKENIDNSSGYRSSPSKSSFGATPQCLWIGQSANNLFNYLSNCLLVTSTQHLTEQISEVLGQLIDTLHADEIYPTFLEDLLATVFGTLQLLYEDENYVFNVGQKKDEQMQRILLLNKSTHVQKFTIEKINNILQKLLDNLSADDTMEIENINKIENLCYIFQILQVLLPKYNVSQNSTQNSQDEKILRKKDITDIWRKKWIEKKVDTNEGSLENKCVLKDCSVVLNKIIIDFMDGYPLIAFSALNCFNVIQT